MSTQIKKLVDNKLGSVVTTSIAVFANIFVHPAIPDVKYAKNIARTNFRSGNLFDKQLQNHHFLFFSFPFFFFVELVFSSLESDKSMAENMKVP